MPVSPPHGGTTARIVGSSSIAMSSAALGLAGAADARRGVVELAHHDLEAAVAEAPHGIREPAPELVGDAGARRGHADPVTGAERGGVADRHGRHRASHADPLHPGFGRSGLGGGEALLEVGEDVVDVLEADREAHQARA